MVNLKLIDLVSLSKADEKERTISINSAEVFRDPLSRERLVSGGMIDLKGNVTDAGMSALQSIRKREKILKEGIPFGDRIGDGKRIYTENTEPWFFIMLGKDQIVTNGELLFVGKPEMQMKAVRGSDDLKKRIPEIIKQCVMKNFKQVWPHSYQAFSLGGVDVVWLSDDREGMMISILAKYFDFIIGRFPKSTFWGSDPTVPIQVKVKSKGLRNIKSSVIALIAGFDAADQLKIPGKIERWRKNEELPKQSVPVMAENGRSTIRKGKEE